MSPAPRRAGGAVLHELPDGTVVLAGGSLEQLLVINDVGAAVWDLLDGRRTVEQIAAAIAAAVPADPATVRADVERFVATLRERTLVAPDE